MHEMGIALQIIEITSASIPPELNGSPVELIRLKVGKLSAVIPDNLRFCFEVASKDTAVEGAELVIEEIPVEARCNDCRNEWTITEPAFACPACKGGSIEMLSGRELDIESIEVREKSVENE
jgi:hydrogenase nickel incorporation protein HypA/HybF